MQITCPNCGARFLTPDRLIGPNGRRVRCGRCSEVFRAELPTEAVEAAAAEPVAAPAPEPAPAAAAGDDSPERPVRVDPLPRNRLPAPRIERKRGLGGWAIFSLVLIALIAVFFLARGPIVESWPPAERFYSLFGLSETEAEPAYELGELTSNWAIEDSKAVLVVTPTVTNTGATEMPAPNVRIALKTNDGRIARDDRKLLPGGPMAPGESRKFEMRFIEPGDVTEMTGGFDKLP